MIFSDQTDILCEHMYTELSTHKTRKSFDDVTISSAEALKQTSGVPLFADDAGTEGPARRQSSVLRVSYSCGWPT